MVERILREKIEKEYHVSTKAGFEAVVWNQLIETVEGMLDRQNAFLESDLKQVLQHLVNLLTTGQHPPDLSRNQQRMWQTLLELTQAQNWPHELMSAQPDMAERLPGILAEAAQGIRQSLLELR